MVVFPDPEGAENTNNFPLKSFFLGHLTISLVVDDAAAGILRVAVGVALLVREGPALSS